MTDDLTLADLTLADEIAALLLEADGGDEAAEKALVDRYATDNRLGPGARISTPSPVFGAVGAVDLPVSRR
ncbi:hypothetical protein [Micromonospora sp. NPDC005203]|uniref:hypothetical protein n=1 Tax=Micromonospora sp. NPDC005203 TaxID=3364226 RepID=UPI00369FB61E